MEFTDTAILESALVIGSAFVLCLGLMPGAMAMASRLNLLDHPTGRKQHSQSTPLVGGIAVFASFVIVTVVSQSTLNLSMLLWFSLVLIVGIADDHYDLTQKFRLIVHALIVLGIAITDGHLVYSVGSILGPQSASTFILPVAALFTAMAVIGAINAVNMIDGVDGLLGSLMLISMIALLIIGVGGERLAVVSSIDVAALIGALTGFLVLNGRFLGLKRAKVFMGDAGSTLIGFILVYLLIGYSQGESALISPVLAGWILGLPLLDASAVIVMRMMGGRSPIEPGRDHLHHILLRRYRSENTVVAIMVACQIVMLMVGLVGSSLIGSNADMVLFWLFVGLVPVRCLLSLRIDPEMAMVGGSVSSKLRDRIRNGFTG